TVPWEEWQGGWEQVADTVVGSGGDDFRILIYKKYAQSADEWVSPLTTTLFPIVQIGADEVRSILQVWRHASNKSISESWASGSDTNADSTWSVTTTDSLEVASGDQLVIFSASTDSVGGTQSLSASGATFSSVTETVALWVNNASVTAGSSNTNVSYTAQNFPAVGGTIILRDRKSVV